MYLTFEEYQTFGGNITDEATFNEFEFEATVQIDWYTFGRLHNMYDNDSIEVDPNVKRCAYCLINLFQKMQSAMAVPTLGGASVTGEQAGIMSQSNDGVSISYTTLSASEIADRAQSQISECIKKYLQNVRDSLGRKVLYRGIYPGE